MYMIRKMRADHVIDFAAEELKKYLRMMMPECGDISISYDPEAREGFRLGLAEDFGLTFPEAKDPFLDDVVHIEADKNGGILTGSNSRSVLFAVYRFLKENGCRWLYPGIDGEYIPIRDIEPVTYHHLADHRFRGHCNEGAESQQCMLETIDYYAKLEMNCYMLEFDVPYHYYNSYYSHISNEKNRPPEPVTHDQVKQWKRVCEAEIAKRGLQFHDMGHGWTAEPYGLDSTSQWAATDQPIPEEAREHLALINGKRELYKGVAMNTNLCMSNPKTRTIMAKAVADYAQTHQNVSYVHVWLADNCRNHCECEECQKLNPSDYYIMIMNELDEELTRRNLDTRIVFLAYVDTMYAPLEARIRNFERFALLYAPIQRSYTGSVQRDRIKPAPEFIRNAWTNPVSAEDSAAFLLDWQKGWKGVSFSYEYHFIHSFKDPGMMAISRRICEDIVSLKTIDLDGLIEDGSQRPFFPNGFAVYIFAEALLNRSCDYDRVKEDYFRHAYGEAWEEVLACLEQISVLFDHKYMEGERSADSEKGAYYNPPHAENLKSIKEVTARERELAEKYFPCPIRVQTVSMRLLQLHAEYCDLAAEIMIEKALGNNEQAHQLWKSMCHQFGRHEIEIERYYDHLFAVNICPVG